MRKLTHSNFVVTTILALILLILLNSGMVRINGVQAASNVIYVDADAPPGGNGTSWKKAYSNLNEAIQVADESNEIWVASGIYYPGESVNSSFILKEGVEIYGGFVGSEKKEDGRDWETNLTILSGDIGGDDITDSFGIVRDPGNIMGPNSYHVAFSGGVSNNTILDGFIITGGSASGSSFDRFGGGMLNQTSNPILKNLKFIGNRGMEGGGIYNSESNPIILNTEFRNNSSTKYGGVYGGGAVANFNSDPEFIDVLISENKANSDAGGMFNFNSNPTLVNIVFQGNSADEGGGIFNNYYSNPILENVVFVGNYASRRGGGVINSRLCDPTYINVTIAFNVAGNDSAGMLNYNNSSAEIRNSIIWGNSDPGGGQVYNLSSSSSNLTNTLVQGGCPIGSTCTTTPITDDPLFVQNPDSGDGSWLTYDDNDYGNLRLQEISPAIDAGDNSLITSATDIDGNPRIFGDYVDLGPYERINATQLFLTIDGNGSGYVFSTPDGISCPEDCEETFDGEKVVVLIADADKKSKFVGWSGDCTGRDICELIMDTTKYVTATFNLKKDK